MILEQYLRVWSHCTAPASYSSNLLFTLPCTPSYPLLLQAALAELNGLLLRLPLAVPAVLNSLLLHPT